MRALFYLGALIASWRTIEAVSSVELDGIGNYNNSSNGNGQFPHNLGDEFFCRFN